MMKQIHPESEKSPVVIEDLEQANDGGGHNSKVKYKKIPSSSQDQQHEEEKKTTQQKPKKFTDHLAHYCLCLCCSGIFSFVTKRLSDCISPCVEKASENVSAYYKKSVSYTHLTLPTIYSV
eukprot:TRINITY_DN1229_c0_g1_i2.p1 TRINITY_DN1229_c0_g1~~TRINITY_DN1229_c0_g1_i2.p1  ORF type:complete len:121 (+),score=7.62 TRINITY_DN1229_c0_g1_i2:143-505(+)